MKKLKIIVLGIFLSVVAKSQDYVPTPAEVSHFFTTKTYVVFEDMALSSFNGEIKKIMKDNWTLTPFDFISYQEFLTKRFDPTASFIIMNQVIFTSDKTRAKYNFISLLLGGPEKIIDRMPDLCPIPLSYFNVDEDHYVYKMGTMIRFMQKHVKFINDNPDMIKKNVLSIYNKDLGQVKQKTLYLVKDEMAPEVDTEQEIAKVYSGRIKFVDREEIAEAIARRDEDVVFLNKVGPERQHGSNSRCYKVLVDALDARFYYFDYHMIDDKEPDGFLISDFKKMNKK